MDSISQVAVGLGWTISFICVPAFNNTDQGAPKNSKSKATNALVLFVIIINGVCCPNRCSQIDLQNIALSHGLLINVDLFVRPNKSGGVQLVPKALESKLNLIRNCSGLNRSSL